MIRRDGAADGTTANEHRLRSEPVTPGGDRSTVLPYRADIDGLRAVAVLLVVLYHAGSSWFGGGYVGVDVFFVLSGFLITSVLAGQAERGSVRLIEFYAGRVRRLLPLAFLTLVVTVGFGLWLLPTQRANELLGDARSALLYVSNWRFADKSVAYVDTDVADGMLTHFWSLSIEEQYYFGWPLVIAAVALIARRRSNLNVRHLIAGLAAIVVVVSFALSVAQTPGEGARAYYLTHLRLWEIAAGAVIAVTPMPRRLPSAVADVFRGGAIVMIIATAVGYGDTTPFPGWHAALPVGATVALVILGGRGTAVDRVLGARPFTYVGERSYALYLWHWPALGVMALLDRRYEWDLSSWLRATIAIAAAFVLSVASHRALENPVRYSAWLKGVPRWTVVGGAVATVGLAVLVVPLRSWNTSQAAASWSELPVAPADAATDRASALYRPCHQGVTAEFNGLEWCEIGDADGDVTVVLAGDSHAQHWGPAFDTAGLEQGWRVLLTTRSACLPYDVPIYALRQEKMDDGCREWSRAVIETLEDEAVDVFVVGRARGYIQAIRNEEAERIERPVAAATITSAVGEFADSVGRFADSLIILEDTPWAPHNVPNCLDDAGPRDAATCDFPALQTPLEAELIAAEQAGLDAATTASAIRSLDDAVCPDEQCRALLDDGMITYRDGSHLTVAFARSQSAAIVELVESALSGL